MIAITGHSAAADSSDIPLEFKRLPVASNLLSDSFERAWDSGLAPQLLGIVITGKTSRGLVVKGVVKIEEVLGNHSPFDGRTKL